MTAPDRIVAKYSQVAFVYDAWTWMTERKSLDAALERADIRDGEAILEVAVGTGVLFEKILRRNPAGRNVGIDLTESMLRRAKRKAEKTRAPFDLRVADARKLPFDDGRFDLVFNNNMLGVLPEDAALAIVKEMFRVLRPSGRIVMVMMRRPEKRLPRVAYDIGAVRLGGWRDVDVKPALRDVGFTRIDSAVISQLGIPSDVIRAHRS